MTKLIVCEVRRDHVEPYTRDNRPYVIAGNHPRFVNGTRLDWGFAGIAIDEGYSIIFIGGEDTGVWKDGDLRERKPQSN